MKRAFYIVVLVGFILGATNLPSPAATDQETQAPPHRMMMQHASEMGKMPCESAPDPGYRMPMMGMMGEGMGSMMGPGMSGMMGGMGHQMEHMVFLDRSEELGLSAEQVGKLKAIHAECRKDNIRTAAEAKIVRLELAELLSGDSWQLMDAESLVRKLQTLEGDIQVRHLQALSDARKVLTAEQLKKAQSGESADNLEGLFQ